MKEQSYIYDALKDCVENTNVSRESIEHIVYLLRGLDTLTLKHDGKSLRLTRLQSLLIAFYDMEELGTLGSAIITSSEFTSLEDIAERIRSRIQDQMNSAETARTLRRAFEESSLAATDDAAF